VTRRARAAFALLLALPGAARARGGLDSSFGARGVVYSTSPFDGAAAGYGVAEDAEGRVVAAGVVTDSSGTPHVAVWRFRADGTPDPGFGRGGVAISTETGWAWGLQLDARGRALIAGINAVYGKGSTRAVLERFLADGGRDPAFGGGGRVLLESPGGGVLAEGGAAAAADPAGGAVVVGQGSDASRRMRAYAWRLRDDGSRDPALGPDGARELAGPGDAADARVFALRRLADGGWLAAGTWGWTRLALWRLARDGSPARGYGAGGVALSDGVGRSIVEDGAGGAWVAGFAYEGAGKTRQERAVLARFAADGSTTAWISLEAVGLRDREAFAVARRPDGGLLAAGYADAGRYPVRAALWALSADGEPDRRFGRGGALVLPASDGGEERIYALGLDARGRALATGLSRDASGRRRLAVWRFTAR
jgi:uncharacterized delta-60 repeat protein